MHSGLEYEQRLRGGSQARCCSGRRNVPSPESPHGQEVRACPRMPKSVRGERAYVFPEHERLLSTLVLLRFRQCHVKKIKQDFCVLFIQDFKYFDNLF